MTLHNKKSIRYNFAHIGLPTLALWNHKKFYKDVFNKNGNLYLNQIWLGLAGRMGIKDSYSFAPVEITNYSDGVEICLITLPDPKDIAEAYYVVVVAIVEKKLFRKQVTASRFFTLELGYDVVALTEAYHVCEWLSPVPVPERANYGTIPLVSKSLFLGVIEAIINGEINARSEQEITLGKFIKQPSCGTVVFDKDSRASWRISDEADMMHGMGHILLRDLYRTSFEALPEHKEKFKQMIIDVERWANVHNGYWSDEQEEQFALQYEAYLSEKFPNLLLNIDEVVLSPILEEVFEFMSPIKE